MKPVLMLLMALLWLFVRSVGETGTHKAALTEKLLLKASYTFHEQTEYMLRENKKMVAQMQAREAKLLQYSNKFLNTTTQKFAFPGKQGILSIHEEHWQSITPKRYEGKECPYLPRVDSLQTMLQFILPQSENKREVEAALERVNAFKKIYIQNETIYSLLTEREAAINDFIFTHSNLPAPILKKLHKQLTYLSKYRQRLAGWKATISRPGKMESTAIYLLNQLPAFKSFWQQNSQLASLFGSPGEPGMAATELQTRQLLTRELRQRLEAAGVNPQQLLQQKIGTAQRELQALKQKADDLVTTSPGNNTTEIPAYKHDDLTTKSLLKRLEWGWNLQSNIDPVQNTGGLPSTYDLAAMAGYRVNDRLITGVGLAYKFSPGSSWKHLNFSHEGMGLRSFLEWKMADPKKGSHSLFSNTWLYGGYEFNYYKNIDNLPDQQKDAWQPMMLIGLSKKIKFKSKSTAMQILWTPKSKHRLPGDQQIIFRSGYNF